MVVVARSLLQKCFRVIRGLKVHLSVLQVLAASSQLGAVCPGVQGAAGPMPEKNQELYDQSKCQSYSDYQICSNTQMFVNVLLLFPVFSSPECAFVGFCHFILYLLPTCCKKVRLFRELNNTSCFTGASH